MAVGSWSRSKSYEGLASFRGKAPAVRCARGVDCAQISESRLTWHWLVDADSAALYL
jgi:hypothetical protein